MANWKDFKRITCKCGRYVEKNDDLFRMSLYFLKKPTKTKTERNEKIIDEIFFSYICPQCDREVVLIKRRAINAAGNIKMLLPIKLIGKEASDYLEQTKTNRINKTNELKYSDSAVFVKGVAMSYFKTINKTHQRPRYINESGYSGDKVECKLTII